MMTQDENDEQNGKPSSKKSEKKDMKKSKKETKQKNGDGIKKPLTAYMLFNNHRRPIIKSEHQCKTFKWIMTLALSLPEVSKMIGEEWNKLTED